MRRSLLAMVLLMMPAAPVAAQDAPERSAARASTLAAEHRFSLSVQVGEPPIMFGARRIADVRGMTTGTNEKPFARFGRRLARPKPEGQLSAVPCGPSKVDVTTPEPRD